MIIYRLIEIQKTNRLEIEKLSFKRNKYGKELLLDCSLFSSQNTKLHKHPFILDFYGIFIITKGTGGISLDNKKTTFQKGSLIFFQSGQIRQWQNVSADFDGYFLVFESEFIETFFQDTFFIYRFQFLHANISSSLECDSRFFTHLVNTCKQINIELANIQDDSHHFLRSLLYYILIEINRKFIDVHSLSLNHFQDNKSLQFLKLLDANIRKFHKVEDYARLMNISRSQLNIIVKRATGKPVSEEIREKLLTEIKRDLLFTNKSIKEICFDINFSDDSNFIRFFKKAVGINPYAFRLNNSK